jgi:hypothetical protein
MSSRATGTRAKNDCASPHFRTGAQLAQLAQILRCREAARTCFAPVRQCASPFRDGALDRRSDTPFLRGALTLRQSTNLNWRPPAAPAARPA